MLTVISFLVRCPGLFGRIPLAFVPYFFFKVMFALHPMCCVTVSSCVQLLLSKKPYFVTCIWDLSPLWFVDILYYTVRDDLQLHEKPLKLPLILLACTMIWTVARVKPFNSYWTMSLLTLRVSVCVYVWNSVDYWRASKMLKKKNLENLRLTWSLLCKALTVYCNRAELSLLYIFVWSV